VLLAFYDYPAEHWIHLRTTNPIESTFATVRLRQRDCCTVRDIRTGLLFSGPGRMKHAQAVPAGVP